MAVDGRVKFSVCIGEEILTVQSRRTTAIKPGYLWMPLALVIVAALLGACRPSQAPAEARNDAAKIESIDAPDLHRVRLSEQAARRLGIQTEVVREELLARRTRAGEPDDRVARKVIPYTAVIYDARGNAWTYVSPQPLTFVRALINVDYIEGNLAVLVDGPPTDTVVVTVGAPELFGAEFGVGH
jgi:hypothetical protein